MENDNHLPKIISLINHKLTKKNVLRVHVWHQRVCKSMEWTVSNKQSTQINSSSITLLYCLFIFAWIVCCTYSNPWIRYISCTSGLMVAKVSFLFFQCCFRFYISDDLCLFSKRNHFILHTVHGHLARHSVQINGQCSNI